MLYATQLPPSLVSTHDDLVIPAIGATILATAERQALAACERHGIRTDSYAGMVLHRDNDSAWASTTVCYDGPRGLVQVWLTTERYTITHGATQVDGIIEQLRFHGDELSPLYTLTYPGCYQYDPSPYVRYTLERSPLGDTRQEQAWMLTRAAYTIPRAELDALILSGLRDTYRYQASRREQLLYGDPAEEVIWARAALIMDDYGE